MNHDPIDDHQPKHTPGPWVKEAHIVRDLEGTPIAATIPSGRPYSEWPANASLIAAAPELLAACKAALGAFEHNHAIDWNDLERAIAKAEKDSL